MTKSLDRLNQIATGFMEAKILLAAAQLRVFDRLRGAGARADDVARALQGTQRGTEILLDALVAMGLLQKAAGSYRNHPDYEPFLLDEAPTQFPWLLRHRNRLFRHWAFLEETIMSRSKPDLLDERDGLEDPVHNEDFIRAMYAVSHDQVAGVVDRIDLSEVRKIADVGGGPGHYLAEFLRRLPSAEGILIDLPLTLRVARKIEHSLPERARLRFVEWDFYACAPPADLPLFDLIFVSQVVHSASAEENVALMRHLFAKTAPGGQLIVHEQVVSPDRTAPPEAAIFAVNMLAMTPMGRTYTEAEIVSWARAAGFQPGEGTAISGRSFLIRARRERIKS